LVLPHTAAQTEVERGVLTPETVERESVEKREDLGCGRRRGIDREARENGTEKIETSRHQ
jgi:hypothetical protein